MNELDKDIEAQEQPRLSEPWPSPGRKLRELRESLGLTQSQVGESLHLTMHYINALENDLYEKLPGKTFAKGYLKSYSALVGADVDDIIERFEKLYGSREERAAASTPQYVRQRRVGDQNRRWVLAAGFMLVAFVGAAWWFGTGGPASLRGQAPAAAARADTQAAAPQQQQQRAPRPTSAEALIGRTQAAPPPQTTTEAASEPGVLPSAPEHTAAASPAAGDALALAETPAPQSAAPADQASSAAGEQALREQTTAEGSRIINLNTPGDDLLVLHLSGTSWVEVDNGQNVRLYNDNLNEGDELTIRGEAPFRVLLGNATMVDVQFNSRAVDLTPMIRGDRTARVVLEP